MSGSMRYWRLMSRLSAACTAAQRDRRGAHNQSSAMWWHQGTTHRLLLLITHKAPDHSSGRGIPVLLGTTQRG